MGLPSTAASNPETLAQHQEAMEPLHLYDIRAVTTNKTMERIIAPMAAQLCHFVIAAEWEGVTSERLVDLETPAEELAKATKELAYVARRLAEESRDELLAGEMLPATQSLLMSGKSILLVAHKLHIQPEVQKHQEELMDSAERVFIATVKILQLEDDAAVRRIIQAAHWLQDCLTALEVAGDMPTLLAAFHGFSESLLLLNRLAEQRLQVLRDSPPRKHLAQTLQILRKCVPMLHAAKHSHLRHPQDQHVDDSKTYVFSLMDSTVKELISLLKDTTSSRELLERNGLFSQYLSQLLGLVSNPNPADLSEGEFNFLVEAVVFHCMLLANSSRPGVKLQLIKHCHHLLMLRKSMSNYGSRMAECIQVLLSSVDQLIGRDVLFLSGLRNAMKHKLHLRDVLAAVSENSLRIQEAARLSYLACAEGNKQHNILVLREEVKVLTEALLQVVDVLSVSPGPATNLSIRAELLQRELAARAKALLLLLNSTNWEYAGVIQNVLRVAQPPALAPRGAGGTVKEAAQMMANIQLVKTVIEAALETAAHLETRESLLSLTDHLLLLTAAALGRAGEHLPSQQDKGLAQLYCLVGEWSATAHYVLMQLQSVKDMDEAALELLLHDSPKDPQATSCDQGEGATSAAPPEEAGQRQDDSNKVAQVAKEMATGMSHMAGFLKRKGPIRTHEQLIVCARQMASHGQVFVRFSHMIAKNCLDARCEAELLRVTEQIQTVSSQLSMISR
ncbi:catenin alpha-2-like [Carettochelys insculpta]|uniref:catenin alpha-2-like n=1 Tax=Carettochelys insculpta TaxID=44489 RepID=UPI003EC03BB4